MSEAPVNRFVLLALHQAQQDRGTKIVIDASRETEGGITYEVDGTWHSFSQPPPHVLRDAINELRSLAGITHDKKAGLIDTEFSGDHIRWNVVTSDDNRLVLTRA